MHICRFATRKVSWLLTAKEEEKQQSAPDFMAAPEEEQQLVSFGFAPEQEQQSPGLAHAVPEHPERNQRGACCCVCYLVVPAKLWEGSAWRPLTIFDHCFADGLRFHQLEKCRA
jgi:hypothetical protein